LLLRAKFEAMVKKVMLTTVVGTTIAGMPDCSSMSCPSMCTCVESTCGNLYAGCAADSQCDGIMNCLFGCSCGNVFCALGCVAGKTLDSISSNVKSCASGCASSDDRTILGERKVTPPTWNVVGRASSKHNIEFQLALKQTNLHKLDSKFWEVSNPDSTEWQNFMTIEEIDSMIAPKVEHKASALKWLKENLSKAATITDLGDAIRVRAPAKDVERLFDTEMYLFNHDNGHLISKAMGTHSVPAEIANAIDFVSGLSEFPMHRSSGKKVPKPDVSTPATSVSPVVIPASLREMYSVPATAAAKVSQGVAEFQGDASYNKADLQTFFNQSGTTADEGDTVADIVGPYSGTYPDMEATLDTQYIMGVGQGEVDWYWTTAGWQYEWASNFYSTTSVPDAVSISWGWAEDGQCASGIADTECSTLGVKAAGYVNRTNVEFQKIGLRGVSLFAASGDSGANGRIDGGCTGTVLHASFPGSSPYITATGATQFSKPEYNLPSTPTACTALGSGYKCASGGVEVAVSSQVAGFTSGGGFSTYTPRPSYQDDAVNAYLNSGVALPPSSYYNNANRGYPDVSALGNGFAVYLNSYGGWTTVGGTSASSPTFAGVSSYLNAMAYNKTGKPLGFLNPFLYKMAAAKPSAFTDIVSGDNKCTEQGCAASCKGYEATKGRDPVTGLGTPVASEMLAYLESTLAAKSSVLV
jgi:tripeptidyl-peptidase-1